MSKSSKQKPNPGSPLPTASSGNRGSVRTVATDNSATHDELYMCRKTASGGFSWSKFVWASDEPNLTVQVDDATIGTFMSVLDFEGDHFAVAETPTHEANITLVAPVSVTVGPWYVNDIPGTATTAMALGYFDTATTVIQGGAFTFRAPANGFIIGIILNSRNSRTAGTAIAKANIGGVTTTFDSDTVVLNGTNTLRASSLVTPANGIAISVGDRIGIDLVTSAWTPITTDATAWIILGLKP